MSGPSKTPEDQEPGAKHCILETKQHGGHNIIVFTPNKLKELGFVTKVEGGKTVLIKPANSSPAAKETSSNQVERRISCNTKPTNTSTENPTTITAESPGRRRIIQGFSRHWFDSLKKDGFIKCPLRQCTFISLRHEDMCTHYIICNGQANNTEFVCPICKSCLKTNDDLELHRSRSHSDPNVELKIVGSSRARRSPPVATPLSDAQLIVRKRGYSKVHKQAWTIAVEEHGYVKCIFQNCIFMALSVDEMIQHYRCCNSKGLDKLVVCPQCHGGVHTEAKLKEHVRISHSGVAKQTVTAKSEPSDTHGVGVVKRLAAKPIQRSASEQWDSWTKTQQREKPSIETQASMSKRPCYAPDMILTKRRQQARPPDALQTEPRNFQSKRPCYAPDVIHPKRRQPDTQQTEPRNFQIPTSPEQVCTFLKRRPKQNAIKLFPRKVCTFLKKGTIKSRETEREDVGSVDWESSGEVVHQEEISEESEYILGDVIAETEGSVVEHFEAVSSDIMKSGLARDPNVRSVSDESLALPEWQQERKCEPPCEIVSADPIGAENVDSQRDVLPEEMSPHDDDANGSTGPSLSVPKRDIVATKRESDLRGSQSCLPQSKFEVTDVGVDESCQVVLYDGSLGRDLVLERSESVCKREDGAVLDDPTPRQEESDPPSNDVPLERDFLPLSDAVETGGVRLVARDLVEMSPSRGSKKRKLETEESLQEIPIHGGERPGCDADVSDSIAGVEHLDRDAKSLDSVVNSSEVDPKTLEIDTQSLEIDPNILVTDATSLDTNVIGSEIETKPLEIDATNLDANLQNFDTDLKTLEIDTQSLEIDPNILVTDAKTVDTNVTGSEMNSKTLDIDTKSTEIDPKTFEMNPKSLEIDDTSLDTNVVGSEMNSKNSEIETKSTEIDVNSVEMYNTQSVESDAIRTEIDASRLDTVVNSSDIDTKTLEIDPKTLDANSMEIDATSLDTNLQSVDTDLKTFEMDPESSEVVPKALEIDTKPLEINTQGLVTDATSLDTNVIGSEINPKCMEMDSITSEIDATSLDANLQSLDTDLKTLEMDPKSSEIDNKTLETDAIRSEINAKSSEVDPKTLETDVISSEIDATSLDVSTEMLDTVADEHSGVETGESMQQKRETRGKKGRKGKKPQLLEPESDIPADRASALQSELLAEIVRTPCPSEKSSRGKKSAIAIFYQQMEQARGKVSPTNRVECGKCGNVDLTRKQFVGHNKSKHAGLGWISGEIPVDLNNLEQVRYCLSKTFVKRGKMEITCELCNVTKRSIEGFVAHMELYCQKSSAEQDAMRVECPVCSRVMLPTSLKVHMGVSHKSGLSELPETEPESRQLGKRAAATKAAELIASLKKEELEPPEDPYHAKATLDRELMLMYKKTGGPRQVNGLVNARLKNEMKTNGIMACKNKGCHFSSQNMEDMQMHYEMCVNIPPLEYRCRRCDFKCAAEDEMLTHVARTPGHVRKEQAEEPSYEDVQENESVSEGEDLEVSNTSGQGRRSKLFLSNRHASLTSRIKFLSREISCRVMGDSMYLPTSKWWLDFQTENFRDLLFPSLRVCADDLVSLDADRSADFLPTERESVSMATLTVDNGHANTLAYRKLGLFEATVVDGVPVMFVGGPIWALAWCPIPNPVLLDRGSEVSQFLAVACHRHMDDVYTVSEGRRGFGVVQIWDFGPLDHSNGCRVPRMALGLAHNFGAVWHMEWCPSGCYDLAPACGAPSRMGLLAAACSDGRVHVFAVPFPEEVAAKDSKWRVLSLEPVLSLVCGGSRPSLPTHDSWMCTRLSWYKNAGHATVAGAFTNGLVCVWDLGATSPLLSRQCGRTRIVFAFKTFQAHMGSVTALSLFSHFDCRYLMSGGVDRTTKIWDLQQTAVPIATSFKGVVTDGVWLSHWVTTVTAYDDGFGIHHGNTMLHSVRNIGFNPHPLLPQNSPVWSVSGSEWSNAVAQGTVAGELCVIFPHQLFIGADVEKNMKYKRMVIGFVDLVESGQEPRQVPVETSPLATPPAGPTGADIVQNAPSVASSSKPSSEIGSECVFDESRDVSAESESEDERCVDDVTQFHAKEFMSKKYHDISHRFNLALCHYPLDNFQTFPNAGRDSIRTSELMRVVPREMYPITSINRVAWNPNCTSHLWLASGFQCGLLRVPCVRGMQNATFARELFSEHAKTA